MMLCDRCGEETTVLYKWNGPYLCCECVSQIEQSYKVKYHKHNNPEVE